MNAETIIKKVGELNDFQTGDDGFVYYAPGNIGLIAAWELRARMS